MVRNFGERRKKKSGGQNKKQKTKRPGQVNNETCTKGKAEVESREVVVYDPKKQESTKNEEPKKPPCKKQQNNGYRSKREERYRRKPNERPREQRPKVYNDGIETIDTNAYDERMSLASLMARLAMNHLYLNHQYSQRTQTQHRNRSVDDPFMRDSLPYDDLFDRDESFS